MTQSYAAQFAGRWVGETQGYAMPAHIWDISVNNSGLSIATRWEHETRTMRMYGTLLPNEAAFSLGHAKAILVDAQHFIIRGWDTNDARGGVGPAYDVVFSRPGLPELQATAVWQAFLDADGASATSDTAQDT